jgi:hypothetical protein
LAKGEAMKSCHYCKEPIDTENEPCHRGVSGWEAYRRKGGGTHEVTGRKPKDLWCCATCIRRIKRGVSPVQQVLA